MSDFPFLVAMIAVPAVGAAVGRGAAEGPRAPGPAAGARRQPGRPGARRPGRRRVRRRRRAVPADDVGGLDPRLRGGLRPRRRRHRAGDAAAHRPAGAAGHRRLLGGRRTRRRRRPAAGRGALHALLLRLAAAARGVHGRRLRRHRRLPVLRLLRGDARPDVLPDRPVRRAAPAVRRGEVLPLQPGRRADHARRRHRSVRGERQRAGRGHLRLRRAARAGDRPGRAEAAVPRLLRRLRHQGPAGPAAHLAARLRRGGADRRRGAARRRPRQGGHLRLPALLPAAVPRRVALLRAAACSCWPWSASSTRRCWRWGRAT